mgnify:CR=1 FL=1
MKFGLRYCNAGRYIYPANAVELLQAGEAAGFASAWTVDHVVVPEGYKSAYPYSDDGKMAGGKNDMAIPDPLIWMAYAAAIHPLVRAKAFQARRVVGEEKQNLESALALIRVVYLLAPYVHPPVLGLKRFVKIVPELAWIPIPDSVQVGGYFSIRDHGTGFRCHAEDAGW